MLTLQFIPYATIAKLNSEERIKHLLNIVKEEADLILKTMESINEKFTGIELGVIHSSNSETVYKKAKQLLVRLLLGNRAGFTIVGPANVVKEIKKDPDKIQLYTTDSAPIPKKNKKK